MNVTQVLRTYLGLSQVALAKAVGITQPDLSEIETLPPYGHTAKYQRLSDFLSVPIEALAKNDFTAVGEDFFRKHPSPDYQPTPKDALLLIGRQGEEFILRRERERLSPCFPALAKLVLPFYKMKCSSPGYDILTFDDHGLPMALEVKTTAGSTQGFRLTSHELDAAKKLTEQGERYVVVFISSWGKESQQVREIPYPELERTHSIQPHHYFCAPLPAKKKEPLNGLTYFRLLRGMRQVDVAQELGVNPSNYCQYERNLVKPSITFYLRASKFYETTVDSLLATYDPNSVADGKRTVS